MRIDFLECCLCAIAKMLDIVLERLSSEMKERSEGLVSAPFLGRSDELIVSGECLILYRPNHLFVLLFERE